MKGESDMSDSIDTTTHEILLNTIKTIKSKFPNKNAYDMMDICQNNISYMISGIVQTTDDERYNKLEEYLMTHKLGFDCDNNIVIKKCKYGNIDALLFIHLNIARIINPASKFT